MIFANPVFIDLEEIQALSVGYDAVNGGLGWSVAACVGTYFYIQWAVARFEPHGKANLPRVLGIGILTARVDVFDLAVALYIVRSQSDTQLAVTQRFFNRALRRHGTKVAVASLGIAIGTGK